MAATSSGLPSIRPVARVTVSNTSLATALTASGSGVQFQRSTDGGVTWQAPIIIPNGPTDGTLDVDTNGNLFIGGEGNSARFPAFARAMRRSGIRHRPLTR